ncbi:MAG: DRTGG domain-containing protein [Chloroflexota bacterium]
MKPILVAGVGEPAGKTAVIAAIAALTLAQGKTASYLKLGSLEDADVRFMREAVGVPAVAGQRPRPADVVLAEWPGPLDSVADAARALDAGVVTVIRYRQGLTAAGLEELLATVGPEAKAVFNAVPERIMPLFEARVASPLRTGGVEVLGLIPESRSLLGFTVGELVRGLDAAFLVNPGNEDALIESLMLGANAPDPAVSYFGLRPHSAVICRSDRPDIQLAALDNPIRCLVFCGGGYRQTSVLHRAEDLGVAVVEVQTGVLETVALLNTVAAQVRFRQAAKVAIAQQLIGGHLDLARVFAVRVPA